MKKENYEIMNDYYDYSDESDLEDEIDDITYFFDGEKILDLYYNIKNRFIYFLDKLSSGEFYCFVIDGRFIPTQKQLKEQEKYSLTNFYLDYQTEIKVILYVLEMVPLTPTALVDKVGFIIVI
jgi:hypothetical protein